MHPIAVQHRLDVVRATRGGFPFTVPVIPLIRRVPESSGDAAGVNVFQVIFCGGRFFLDVVVLLELSSAGGEEDDVRAFIVYYLLE